MHMSRFILNERTGRTSLGGKKVLDTGGLMIILHHYAMRKPRKSRYRFKPKAQESRSSRAQKLYLRASRGATDIFGKLKMTDNLIMLVLAIIIGTLAGFGAVGVRALIREISGLCFWGDGTLLENIAAAPWYTKIVIPAIGGLIVGPIIYRFAPEAKGTGVPEVMQSVLLKSGHIRPRVAFFKTLVSTITMGTGGSVGREGPIIQIGSSLGSTVGQFFNIPAKRLKTLVGCGAAAGIAAAFNAPIAGALFAVEIILMDYAVAQFSPIVISSVMATVVSHAFEGDFPAIEVVGNHVLRSPFEIGLYIGLGVLCGVISYVFIKVLYSVVAIWEREFRIPSYIKPVFGGVMIGIIGLFFPQIMGVGYDSINLALNHESMTYMGIGSEAVNSALGSHTFWVMVFALVFVKIFATSLTLGSGGSGGIFAPSLFIGAMLGGAFGHFAHTLLPGITASPGTYALIAMGGLVAGTTRAPITAIITVFELTKDVSIILPLMVTCIIATIVSSKFSRESIYTLKLLLRNVNVKDRAEVSVMKTLFVKDHYSRDFESVPQNMRFNEIVMKLISGGLSYISVHDIRTRDFIGMISANDIKDMMFQKDILQNICIAEDIAHDSIARVSLSDNCEDAVRKMRHCSCDVLPVMDPANPSKQIGILRLQDVMHAYGREIEHIDMTSDLANKITMTNLESDIRFLEGYVITELPAPRIFVGKTIKKLRIRNRYGVDIISIKSESRRGRKVDAIPRSDHKIEADDVLVVAGKVEWINRLKKLE